MMDGLSAIVGEAFRELHGSYVGGINVVLSHHVRAIYKNECDRRRGGVNLGHVKGHSGDPGNEAADSLCELGKGPGPYSRLKTWVSRETGAQAAFRLNSGEGHPHAAVPGYYCNVWATEEQRLANDAEQRFALPPVSNSKSKKKQSQPRQSQDFGSGVKLFGDKVSWREKVVLNGKPKTRILQTCTPPRRPGVNLAKLAGTPSAELYHENLVALARKACISDELKTQDVASEAAVEDQLCCPRFIWDANLAERLRWETLYHNAPSGTAWLDSGESLDDILESIPGEGRLDHTRATYGSAECFVRAQPFLRRNVASTSRSLSKTSSGMKVMGTINKEYLSSEQCTRTALVKRLRFLHARKFLLPVRFNYKLMDQPEGYTGRDVMIGCQAVDDEGAAQRRLLKRTDCAAFSIYTKSCWYPWNLSKQQPTGPTFRPRERRSGPFSNMILRGLPGVALIDGTDLSVWRRGLLVDPDGDSKLRPGPGFGGASHLFWMDLERWYPHSRLRRIYDGGTGRRVDWKLVHRDHGMPGQGGEVSEKARETDWSVMDESWGRDAGIVTWQLSNARLGQRHSPTAADWQRLWNTAAKEGVVLADSLAQRRKERRRLQKEYEHARDGLPASVRRDGTPGTRKKVKSDPEKAQRILEQLERWVADPEVDDVELSDDDESDCSDISGELEDGTGKNGDGGQSDTTNANPDAAAQANAAAEQHEGPDIGPGEATAPANTEVMEQFSAGRMPG